MFSWLYKLRYSEFCGQSRGWAVSGREARGYLEGRRELRARERLQGEEFPPSEGASVCSAGGEATQSGSAFGGRDGRVRLNSVDDARLEVEQQRARHVVLVISLVEEDIFPVSRGRRRVLLKHAILAYAVLEAELRGGSSDRTRRVSGWAL